MPEKANSVMLVLAAITAPAARSRRSAGASVAAGGASASTLDPARVGGGAGGLGIHGEASPRALAVRVGDASERLLQPVARGAGRRRAGPGRLLLRPHDVWRSKERGGRAREMQESTTDHLHFLLPTVRLFVDASRGNGRCHKRMRTSARSAPAALQ